MTRLYIQAATMLAVPGIMCGQTLGEDWKEVIEDPEYGDRIGQAAVVHDNAMWMLGGLHGQWFMNDVWKSEDGRDWDKVIEDAGWSGRAFHTAVSLGGQIWVMGGYDGELRNDVWSSTDGKTWDLATESAAWGARTHHTSVTFDDKLWVIGGHESWERKNDVWFSEDGAAWEAATMEAPWWARSHHAAAVHNGRLYIAGGAVYDYRERRYFYYDDVWSSENGADWIKEAGHAGWSARHLHQMVSLDGYLWLIGGDDEPDSSAHLKDVWKSQDGTQWQLVTDDADFERRNMFSCLVYNDKLWMLGGMRYSGGIFDPKPSIWISADQVSD
jgi:hypothetical protein